MLIPRDPKLQHAPPVKINMSGGQVESLSPGPSPSKYNDPLRGHFPGSWEQRF